MAASAWRFWRSQRSRSPPLPSRVVSRAPRTSGGFRCYSDETVARLLFVRNAIRFGFTSKELAGFLKARDSGRPPCHSVRAAGQRLLKEVDEQLARLHEARAAMAETLTPWDALPNAHAMVATVSHREYAEMGLDELTTKLLPKGVFVDVKASFELRELADLGYTGWRL